MPVRVYIPTRICVDVDALFDRQADIEEALAAAAGRALANSRDVVLAKRGGYVAVFASPPEIIWTGTGLGSVPSPRRAEIEECVTGVFSRLVKRAGICDRGQVADPLPDRPGEKFDEESYNPYTNAYTIPSYDDPKRKTNIPVADPSIRDPFAPPTRAQMKAWAAQTKKPLAPLDYADLGKRLRSNDLTDRSNAALEMLDHILDGDREAFHLALWAMRTDNAAPTEFFLSAFRQLAKNNPKKFEELLRAELATRPQELLTIRRSDTNLPFDSASTARSEEVRQISDILAAIVRLAITIPAAKEIFSEMESHMEGLRRLVALIDALVEIRLKMLTYLRDERTLTVDDLFRHGFAGKAPPPPIDPTDPKTLATIEHNTMTLPRVFGILASLAGEARAQSLLYDLQNDLLENYRWIAATLDGIQQVDGLIMIYREYYKESANKLDEVQVLQEARKLYLSKVADNWLPKAALAINLTREADRFFKDWYGVASDRKIKKLQTARQQLDYIMTSDIHSAYNPYLRDSFDDNYFKVRDQLGGVFHEMVGLYSHDRDIEHLVLITKLEEKLSVISVYVLMLMYWHGVHQLSHYIGKEKPGNSDERKKWMARLEEVRNDIQTLYKKPDLYSLSYKPDGWKSTLEGVQRDIEIANGRDVFLTFVIVIVAIVVTAGLAAIALPEEVTLLVSLLFEAGVFTATTAVLQATILDKPVDSADLAKSFAENFITFGVLRILNAGVVAGARKIAAGRALTQLGLIFGAQAVVNIGTALIVQRLETGEWPDDLETFIVAGLLMHTVVGLLSGPAMLEQLQKAALYDLYNIGQALNDEYNVWLKDMDKVYKRGGPSKFDFEAAQKRGQALHTRAAEMLDKLSRLSDDVLAKVGLTRARASELAEMASDNAKIIENSKYDPSMARRALPPPEEITGIELVPLGPGSFQYNSAAPEQQPSKVIDFFKSEGYEATDTGGGVLRLRDPKGGPTYLLMPARPDALPAGLMDVIGGPKSQTRKGYMLILQQTNPEKLLSQLTTVAQTAGPETAKSLLRAVGRFLNQVNVEELEGMSRFLELPGSDPKTLAKILSPLETDEWTATISKTLMTMRDFVSDTAKGLEAFFAISPDLSASSALRMVANFEPAQVIGILESIQRLQGRSEGLIKLVGGLRGNNPQMYKGIIGVLRSVNIDLDKYPDAKVVFEDPILSGDKVIRISDYLLIRPGFSTPIRNEVKEIYALSSLGKRAVQEFANDIVDDAKVRKSLPVPVGGSRPFFETITWRIRDNELAQAAAKRLKLNDTNDPRVRQEVIEDVKRKLRPAFDHQAVQKAVSEGVLSQADLEGYIKAFDAGLPFVLFF